GTGSARRTSTGGADCTTGSGAGRDSDVEWISEVTSDLAFTSDLGAGRETGSWWLNGTMVTIATQVTTPSVAIATTPFQSNWLFGLIADFCGWAKKFRGKVPSNFAARCPAAPCCVRPRPAPSRLATKSFNIRSILP